ncbi:metallophosphoesterase [Leucobacter sp. wl10]|uniref:metallophosphoesterase n=1 Tax=Leucobacter sp. wl10 TaxID=2304677 RepID=UPI000E5B4DEF|nr:metallophosphoesterase [Leucobacter sp. wl10]RGE20303.1 phosphoesterase [Leucobacter sp. wl10]
MSSATGRFTVLHVSDVHATEEGLLYGTVDGVGRLERVGDYARSVGMTPEAVVITGDLIQRGHPGAYASVARACARLEEIVGAPVFTVLGNHDEPAAAASLPGHHHRHYGVEHVEGHRILRLDSSAGSLGPAQLAWLAETLREPYGAGSIIALHHPPVESPLPSLSKQGLADAHELLTVLERSDTRAILAGHFHHPLAASLGGIPVFVGPSLAYHQVMDAGPDTVAGHDAPMFSLVQLTAPGVSAAAIDLRPPQPIFALPITSPSEKAENTTHAP